MPVLPDPNARQTGHRVIPTTTLNASGPSSIPPEVPPWVVLRESGRKWWDWAWTTPQACAWGTNVGMEDVVARRASMVDDLDALEWAHSDVVEMAELLDLLEQGETIKWLFQRLVSMTTGRLAVQKAMTELDNLLGLTPKGMAALRWVVVDDAAGHDEADAAAEEASQEEADELAERRRRLASGDA